MSQYDFDLLVIGGGSGGVRTARWSAGLGAKVAICEEDRYGGTCVLRGCIPKKLMLAGSELPSVLKYFSAYGWSVGEKTVDWSAQKLARDKELSRLEGIYENLLHKKQVTVLKGHGRIVAPHKIEVGGKIYSSRFILIATGGQASLLDVPGAEKALTSDDVFKMNKQPRSILIMGSGYIGVEFAGIFNGFGSQVSLVFRRDKLLRGFDKDIRSFLQEEMIKAGVEIIPQHTIKQIVKKEDKQEVTLQSAKGEQRAGASEQVKTVDAVLFAVGRKPNTSNLGLENLGVETNKAGEIKVNEYFETSVKGVYALGDCADTPYQLTPTATAEGVILAENLFSSKEEGSKGEGSKEASKKKMDYHFVPTAVFSVPPVAVVGLTEEQAKEKGHEVKVYTSRFRPLKYTVTSIDKKTFMKMVVDQKTDKVLGIHIAGDDAPEMMQGFAVALKAGACKSDFDKTVGIHPTSAEELVTMR